MIKRQYRIVFVIGILSFMTAVFAGYRIQQGPYEDAALYRLLGRSLAEGKGFLKSNFPGEGIVDTKRAPLYPLFIGGVMHVLGDDINVLRLSSTLLMLLALMLFWGTIMRFGIQSAGALAFVFCVVNPYLHTYGREFLTEAGFTLLVISGLGCLWHYERVADKRAFYGAIVLFMLSFFQRYIGVVFIPATLFIAWRKKDRHSVMVCGVAGVFCSLWILKGLFDENSYIRILLNSGSYLHKTDSMVSLFGLIRRYTYEACAYAGDVLPDVLMPPLRFIAPRSSLWVLKIVTGLVLLWLIIVGMLNHIRRSNEWTPVACLICYCTTIPLFNAYFDRFLVPMIPLFAYFTALGLFALPWKRIAYIASAIMILAGITGAVYQLQWIADGYGREWRGFYAAAQYLKEHRKKEDICMTRKPFLLYELSGMKNVSIKRVEGLDDFSEYAKNVGAGYVLFDTLPTAGEYYTRKYIGPLLVSDNQLLESIFESEGTQILRIKQ